MRHHEAFDTAVIVQEAQMPQLVEFIRANCSRRTSPSKPLDINFGSGEQREAASGKCHLGGRGEDECTIWMVGLFRQG